MESSMSDSYLRLFLSRVLACALVNTASASALSLEKYCKPPVPSKSCGDPLPLSLDFTSLFQLRLSFHVDGFISDSPAPTPVPCKRELESNCRCEVSPVSMSVLDTTVDAVRSVTCRRNLPLLIR